uniref:uncharacterized protein LOC120343275 n=1 Tax=Styela clava TaxID=7725 RepID=UPI001939AA0F|nr:uncharacterized protein LOC120343275 [Styela clava]
MENPEDWYDILGFVLLGIRSVTKEDLGLSSAEILYGAHLRLPGELVDPRPNQTTIEPYNYVNKMRRFFNKRHSVPTREQPPNRVYIPEELNNATRVYIRVDSTRRALQPVYTGPHRVISRSNKYFTVEYKGNPYDVSTDRVKPAFLSFCDVETTTVKCHPSPLKPQSKPDSEPRENPPILNAPTQNSLTRRGRVIRTPRQLDNFLLAPIFEINI